MDDEFYMRIAIEEAEQALQSGEFPVGAVVVLNGEIIGKGRKHTSNFHMGHAETVALHKALEGKRFNREDDLVIYTTLEPCIMCYGTILHCPIHKLVYAMEDPWGGSTHIEEKSLPTRHQNKIPEIRKGILRTESKELLKKFLETTSDPFWAKGGLLFKKTVFED